MLEKKEDASLLLYRKFHLFNRQKNIKFSTAYSLLINNRQEQCLNTVAEKLYTQTEARKLGKDPNAIITKKSFTAAILLRPN